MQKTLSNTQDNSVVDGGDFQVFRHCRLPCVHSEPLSGNRLIRNKFIIS